MKTPDYDHKNYIVNVATLVIAFIAMLISAFVYHITFKTYNAQLEQIINQELPNLKILTIGARKNYINMPATLYNRVYCRILKGEATNKYTFNDNIPIFDIEDEQIETGFIEEIESHIGNNETYITYFGGDPYLMVIHASSKERYLIEHANVIINLHNYGSTISALSIESFTAYYKNKLEPIVFQGNKDDKITLSPDENNSLDLIFDEVTTDLRNSLCDMSYDTYIALPEYMDLLKTHMVENTLNYDKLEIIFHCWDLFNNETVSKITIEYNGNFFISTTSIIDKNT
jgi:hypothetical protein